MKARRVQSTHEGLIPPNTLRYSELHELMLIEKFKASRTVDVRESTQMAILFALERIDN